MGQPGALDTDYNFGVTDYTLRRRRIHVHWSGRCITHVRPSECQSECIAYPNGIEWFYICVADSNLEALVVSVMSGVLAD